MMALTLRTTESSAIIALPQGTLSQEAAIAVVLAIGFSNMWLRRFLNLETFLLHRLMVL